MPEKISDKVWIAIITVIGSVLTAVITTYGVIAINGRGIAENQQKLSTLSEQATDLQKRILPIGTVIASLLSPAEFAAQVGDPDTFDIQHSKWVLADGRAVSGTGWAKLRADAPIPNLCGVFLRGKSHGKFLVGRNDGKRTDVPDIDLGDYRDDTVGPHQNKIRYYDPGSPVAGGGIYWDGGKGYRLGPNVLVPLFDDFAETQPKNVTVNFFIRIND